MSTPKVKIEPCQEEDEKSTLIKDVQSYLTAKYCEALRSGDKSFANSCLLSTRLFSSSQNPVDEEQALKSESDVNEAARYFSSILDQLFANDGLPRDNVPTEILAATNQMKEEVRLLITELKTQALKLKSTPDPLNMRQAPPISSPRSRMSSEDRSIMSRDTVQKLDSHLISHKKSCFYQELFDSLTPDTRKNLIEYSINNSDNPFERCRLMMLAITLSNECVRDHGLKLIRTLIELADPSTPSDKAHQRTTRAISMCHYAKGMLVLDAVPLILGVSESQELEINIDELIDMTFKYYAEFTLNSVANEFDLEELHESVRKTLASIDPLRPSAYDTDHIEERINLSLNLLFDRFLLEFANDTHTVKLLEKVRETIASETPGNMSIFKLLPELELDVEIPENILLSSRDESIALKARLATATPPPKGRGRAKKAQTSVIVSPDDGLQRHLVNAARKTIFIFNSFAQVFFMQSSQYLKWTRCMLPIGAKNPLADAFRAELVKNQRRSRQANSDTISPAKKHKGDHHDLDEGIELRLDHVLSSASNQDSRLRQAYAKLKHEAREFIDKPEIWFNIDAFVKPEQPGTQNIERLWARFNDESPRICDMKWFKRIQADWMLSQGLHEKAVQILRNSVLGERGEFIKKEEANDERVLTVPMSASSSPSVDVALLRTTTQLIHGHIQLVSGDCTFNAIADLLTKIKQTGLVVSAEDTLHEITLDLSEGRPTEDIANSAVTNSCEFPLLTVPSLVHYCIQVLMDILKCYVTSPSGASDLAIGHAIVLSQASWPRYSSVYDRCIDWIRANKPKSTTPQSISASTKFTYPDFFYFVQDPGILEDFMALLNSGYTLDIKSSQNQTGLASGGQATSLRSSGTSTTSTTTRSGKAITTRGVNKSFKEDLKVALVAQMKHSCTPVPLDLIIEFIQSPLIPFLQTEAQTKLTK